MEWAILQQEKPDDYVIATGKQHTVREFVTLAARELGITLRWEGKGLSEVGIIDAIDLATRTSSCAEMLLYAWTLNTFARQRSSSCLRSLQSMAHP